MQRLFSHVAGRVFRSPSADYISPGRIFVGGKGALYVGELDGRESERVARLVRDLPDAKSTGNILGYLWAKEAYGAMLFATAVSDLSIADALEEPRYRTLFVRLAQEVLAVAPIVVVYLGSLHVAPWFSVAVIASYLTFFPVAINTLRGLQSTNRRAVELMRSYAAGRLNILWKLRIPAALPYIFSALKVSATASIVGAIIGEAPSSIQDGLGGFIVNFNQYYSLAPENLWATNLIAALLGIAFFLAIVLVEAVVVRRAPEHVA